MDKWEFLRWRRTLGYTQEEAGEKLGVARGTIVNWERGTTRIPQAIDLACCELTRRSKQRPDFGPVNLIYSDCRVSSRTSLLQCELYSSNNAAIGRALNLSQSCVNLMIIEDGGSLIWSASELLRECERRRDEVRLPGLRHKPKGNPDHEPAVPVEGKPR